MMDTRKGILLTDVLELSPDALSVVAFTLKLASKPEFITIFQGPANILHMIMAHEKHQFALNDCKAALKETLEILNLPENAAKLDDARNAAGNDMLKSMQTVFPAATQMQMQVIQRFGFLPDGEGLVQFTKAVRVYEEQDQEVRQLNNQLRAILIPAVNVPHPVAPIMNQNGAS